MLDRLQQRLTYANVMATIAVFGVLAGGGAYAASKIGASDIAKNAVRSKHIKQSAVKSKHVKDGQLRVADLADEAKGARAFALAGRNNGFGSGLPHPGFASATRDSEGVYCLTPESGGSIPTGTPPRSRPSTSALMTRTCSRIGGRVGPAAMRATTRCKRMPSGLDHPSSRTRFGS